MQVLEKCGVEVLVLWESGTQRIFETDTDMDALKSAISTLAG